MNNWGANTLFKREPMYALKNSLITIWNPHHYREIPTMPILVVL